MSAENQQLEAMIEGLSPAQTSRLLTATTAIALEAQKRFGVTPAIGEVLALAQVRAATLEGYEPDFENALYQLSTEAPSILGHRAASAASDATSQAVLDNGETPTGLTAEQIADMPTYVRDYVTPGMSFEALAGLPAGMRMTIARCIDMTKEQRNPTTLTAPEMRNAVQEQPAPKDAQTRNAVPPHRAFEASVAKMNAARSAQ